MKKLVGLAMLTMIFGVGCQKASKSDSHSQNQVTAPIVDEENVAIDKKEVEKKYLN